MCNLDRLQMVEVEQDGERFLLRSEVQGTCSKVSQAVGVALPSTVQHAPGRRARARCCAWCHAAGLMR